MRAEIERFSPGEADHFDAFLAMSEEIYRVGFEQLGDFAVRLGHRHGAPRAATGAAARLSQRLWPGVALFRDERLRAVFSFHPLLIGGDPVPRLLVYCLIAFLENRFGVHSPIGGVGALVSGLVGLIEGQGGAPALQRRRQANPDRERRRERRGA